MEQRAQEELLSLFRDAMKVGGAAIEMRLRRFASLVRPSDEALAKAVAQHAAAVLLIGRDAPLIRQALADTGVLLEDCASLEEAVDRAGALARPGQAVLLSPACASFDMFRNYGHRAQVFVDAVHRLAQAQGQPC